MEKQTLTKHLFGNHHSLNVAYAIQCSRYGKLQEGVDPYLLGTQPALAYILQSLEQTNGRNVNLTFDLTGCDNLDAAAEVFLMSQLIPRLICVSTGKGDAVGSRFASYTVSGVTSKTRVVLTDILDCIAAHAQRVSEPVMIWVTSEETGDRSFILRNDYIMSETSRELFSDIMTTYKVDKVEVPFDKWEFTSRDLVVYHNTGNKRHSTGTGSALKRFASMYPGIIKSESLVGEGGGGREAAYFQYMITDPLSLECAKV